MRLSFSHSARIRGARSAAVAVLLTIAVAGVGVDGSSARNDPPSARGGAAYDDEESRDARRRAESRAEDHRRQRETPDARRHRERTRSAYRSLSGREALALGKRSYGDLLTARSWDGLRLQTGERLVRYLGTHGALVEQAGTDEMALVDSAVPLTTKAPSGSLLPVDLSLRRTGSGFEPTRSPAAVELPDRLGNEEGVELTHSGVSVRPVTPAPLQAEATDTAVFYPDAAQDLDFFARPVPEGVETFAQVRSAASPESLGLKFDVPDGAKLERHGDRVDVVKADRTIASVAPPTATDADGEQVPVSFSLTGDTVELHFPHRNADLAYPLMIDPTVTDSYLESANSWNGWASATPYSGPDDKWHYQVVPGSAGTTSPGFLGTQVSYGLYNNARQGYNYAYGQKAEWMWVAPDGVRVQRFEYGGVDTQPANGSCTIFGIWGYGWEAGPDWQCGVTKSFYTNKVCVSGDCTGVVGGNDGNYAVFTVQIQNAGYYAGNPNPISLMRSANIVSHDTKDPDKPTPGARSDWFNSQSSLVTATGQDRGWGVKSFVIDKPVSGGSSEQTLATLPCTGVHGNRCPATWNGRQGQADLNVFTGNLPEGVNNLTLRSRDLADRVSPPAPFVLKVDRTAPTFNLSGYAGSLWGNRDHWLRDGTYDLKPDVRDAYSGVRKHQFFQVGHEDPGLVARDSFSRTQATGWGTADVGGGWTNVSGSSGSVDGSEAVLPASSSTTAMQYLPGAGAQDTDTSARITFRTGRPASGVVEARLLGRSSAWGTDFGGTIGLDSSGRILASGNDTGLRYTAGDKFRARVLIETVPRQDTGRDADWDVTRTSVRVWKDGTPEPGGWDYEETGDDDSNPGAGGTALAAYSYPATGTVSFDDLRVIDLAAQGSSNQLVLKGESTRSCNTAQQCPTAPGAQNPAPTFTWDSAGSPEGEQQFQVSAMDALDQTASQAFTVKLDRTVPSIAAGTASGTLTQPRRSPGGQTLNLTAHDDLSGIERVELLIDDATNPNDQPAVVDTEPGSCTTAQCGKDLAATLEWNDQNGPPDANVTARLTDQAGNKYDKTWRSTYVDDQPPVIDSVQHQGLPSRWTDGSATPTSTVAAHDDGTGVSKLTLDFGQPVVRSTSQPGSCGSGWPPCTRTLSKAFNYGLADLPEGDTEIRATAEDASGNKSTPAGQALWRVRIDRSNPQITLAGPLKLADGQTVVTGGYDLVVNATDGSPTAPRSGVEKVEGQVKRGTTGAWTTRYSDTQTCATESCAMTRTWRFDSDDYAPGAYSVRAISTDAVGHATTSEEIHVTVGTAPLLAPNSLGLEDWFQYDSTETGAGTRAHVNLANGNLIWHSVPITNPGRGLSSFVNVTYNSQGQPDEALLPYDQAGQGFSVGTTGITRLNEPLDLSRVKASASGTRYGSITLTDDDGTRHRFTPTGEDKNGDLYSDAWEPPPGVQLHLRRYSAKDPLSPQLGNEQLTDPKRAWAATRPDGITHFFDSNGYQTYIQDRNGNTIAFEYRYASASGTACALADSTVGVPDAAAVDDKVCVYKLRRLTDSAGVNDGVAGRSLTFDYYAKTGDPAGQESGRLKSITDHAGRVTAFTYDGDGYLTSMTTASGDPAARTFGFHYEDAGSVPAARRYMDEVTDPRGAATRFAYSPRTATSQTGLAPRAALSVTDRRDHPHGYAYGQTQADGEDFLETTVTDARNDQSVDRLDKRGRLRQLTDARGVVTKLSWDDTTTQDNNVEQITEAAGDSNAEAVSKMTYNAFGQLETSTDPEGNKTDFEYRFGAGTMQSPRGTDAQGQFVSDLTWIVKPEGTKNGVADDDYKTIFELDPAGNVTAVDDPGPYRAETVYGAYGLISTERELARVGDGSFEWKTTTYPAYDASGMPTEKVDPRGNATPADGDGRWTYRWDAVGNVLGVTDPRGAGRGGPSNPNAPFTTTLTYDAQDQLRTERVPKRSEQGEFISREHHYDANGNEDWSTDGESARTDMGYSATDQMTDQQSPAVDHYESGSARDVTKVAYDAEDNVVSTEQPEGVGTSTAGDHVTCFSYDAVNAKTVERQLSGDGDGDCAGDQDRSDDLITSYAYDPRGNVVGLADPRENAAYLQSTPAQNVAEPSRRRFTYSYDRANRRRFAVQDPGSGAGKLNLATEFRYDGDDNVRFTVDPRGSTSEQRYDQRDMPTDQVDGLGHRTHYERRADGQVTQIVSPRGTAAGGTTDFTTNLEYDPAGDLISRSLPRAPNQYGPGDLKWRWTRNAVGDPETVTDPRGNAIHSTFLDSGDLRTTDRPSQYEIDPASGKVSEKDPGAIGNDGQPDDLPDSGGQGDFGAVDGQPLPDLLPKAGPVELSYDNELRLTSVKETTPTADGATATIVRDKLGRVVGLKQPFDRSDNAPAARASIDQAFGYDGDGNLRSTVDGEGNETVSTYDNLDRLRSEAHPGSTTGGAKDTTRYAYDANGNVTETTTPAGPVWKRTYDNADRLASEEDPLHNLTAYGYDGADNQNLVRSPRGSALPAGNGTCDTDHDQTDRDCFETKRVFDAANQMVSEYDGHGEETKLTYDEDGNVTKEDAPGAAAAPGESVQRRVTKRSYDGRDLPWTETTGSGDQKRTKVTEYDPNGNLRREVNPQGVGSDGLPQSPDTSLQQSSQSDSGDASLKAATRNATVREYSPDNLLTAVHTPWDDRDTNESDQTAEQDKRRFRTDYYHDPRGRVTVVNAPYEWTVDKAERCKTYEQSPDNADCTARTSYTHYDTGWIKTSTDPVATDPADSSRKSGKAQFEYRYDERGLQTYWRAQRKGDTRRSVTRDYFPSGQLAQRRGEKGENDSTPRIYTYAWNPNGQMTQMTDDRKSGHADRTTNFFYDAADRQTTTNELPFGGGANERGKDTVLVYDRDGNVERRQTDGRLSPGRDPDEYVDGKLTRFTFDSLGREVTGQMCTLDKDKDTDPACDGTPRRFTTDYYPSGERKQRTKIRTGAKDVADYEYRFDDGRLSRMVRKRSVDSGDPATAKDQEYAYDTNGNRTKDERGTYVYNARDQVTSWTRGAGRRNAGTNVRYELNGSGAMTKKTDSAPATKGGGTLNFSYLGDRLERTDFTSAGSPTQSVSYKNDDVGNIEEISATGIAPTKFSYDEFDRMTGSRGPMADDESKEGCVQSFEYDGLDRRDSKSTTASSAGSCKETGKRDYAYVGMSENLSDESTEGPGKQRDYDYDSDFERLGMSQKDTSTTGGGNSDPTYRSYAKDANGSVEGLEDTEGKVPDDSRYTYDPYGEQETQKEHLDSSDPQAPKPDPSQQAEGELGDDAKDNPFRFEGFYYDSGVKSYDMQARNYRPEVGQFLTEDRFESSSGDFNLQSDPLTQQRYAFAGGNPVNRVEWNGHYNCGPSISNGPCKGKNAHQIRKMDRNPSTYGARHDRQQQQQQQGPTQIDSDGTVERSPASGVSHREAVTRQRQHPAPIQGSPTMKRRKAVIEYHKQHPNNFKVPGIVHTGLDIAGEAPVIGEPADGLNAALYAGEGDWKNAAISGAGVIPFVGSVGTGGRLGYKGYKGTKKGINALDDAGDASKGAKRADAGSEAKAGAHCASSFVPGTAVVMADGSRKAIEDVRVGDLVLATDPQSGETGPHRVTRLITSAGTKRLVKLTVAGKTTISTANHPYYLVDEHRWARASELEPGDRLRRPDGSVAIIERAQRFTVIAQRVHNMTVEGDHTYYAGATPVLVHNAGCKPNQMNREIRAGNAPPGIKRIDRPRSGAPGERIHATFSDRLPTLNIDGTWGHTGRARGGQMPSINNKQREWLSGHGFEVPAQ